MNNTYKIGDKVRYRDEGTEGDIFTVYNIYSDEYVSLSLREYPDHEQDNQTHISEIIPV